MSDVVFSRRRFFQLAGGLASASMVPVATAKPDTEPRHLALHNLHTGESVDICYWCDGQYLEAGLQALNRLLRDHRANEQTAMDLRLLDLMHALYRQLPATQPLHIVSGYRSPRTNDALRKASSGVAKRSLHMEGKAVDLRVPGLELARLKRMALGLEGGGVGFYPRSDFIHLDVGRVRYWRG